MEQIPIDPRGFRAVSVWWLLIREVIMFTCGITGLAIESTHDEPRTLVVLTCGGLVGLPIARIIDRIGGAK